MHALFCFIRRWQRKLASCQRINIGLGTPPPHPARHHPGAEIRCCLKTTRGGMRAPRFIINDRFYVSWEAKTPGEIENGSVRCWDNTIGGCHGGIIFCLLSVTTPDPSKKNPWGRARAGKKHVKPIPGNWKIDIWKCCHYGVSVVGK